MAYEKPVIAADTPECRGPVDEGRNGYLVPPRNSKALAAAIKKIMSDSALRAKMGRESLEKIHKEFDDEIVFGSLIEDVLFPLASAKSGLKVN